ncbi:NDP-sugar synthase [Acidimicrobiia bacterium]|jgi:NDP-sugar pyrophosphorylase family protein|nr:NDP-sugar synthase [Acidimicrobiia bacterium]
MSKTIYLLVGGEATRLKPLSEGIPKALLTVKGTSIVDLILDNLEQAGFSKFKLICSIKHKVQWEQYQNQAKKSIELLFETEKLDTAGYIVQNIETFEETFFCMNGDLLLDMDFQTFISYIENASNSTICSVQVDNPSRFGVLHLDNNKIINFIEKPDDLKYGNNISMGFYYIYKKDILKIKEHLNIPASFEKDVFPSLAQNLLLDCYKVDGNMIDVGTRESYIKAHTDIDDNWIAENVTLGLNTKIENSVVFENSQIGNDVKISNAIILKDSVIPDGTIITEEIYK